MVWPILFEQRILNRGYGYFRNGAVIDFAVKNGTMTATVNGTEKYDVEISIGNDEIEDMHCSCPYAEGGKNCKHMAAVLYQWDFMKEDTREDAAAVIEQANEVEIRRFLTDVLSNDQQLLAKFKSQSQSTAAAEEEKSDDAVPVYEMHNEDITISNSKAKKKRGCGASFRLFHLKFWIFITGVLVFELVVAIFHPEIKMEEAIIMLLITVPIFLLLLKRHKYLKQYFDSAEYEFKKEEKRCIKAHQQQQKYVEQQRRVKEHKAGGYSEPVSKQKDRGRSGCCLIALFLLIFYVPIKTIAELTKKYI